MENAGLTIFGFVILGFLGFIVWQLTVGVNQEAKRKEQLRRPTDNPRRRSWFSEPWK